MKLLRLKIENKEGFRSLQQGFEINFHSLADSDAMEYFRPFCFAGLNGSGKSNVLEALANIFYHLEVCVARYLPQSIQNPKNFKRTECTPDSFTLEYLIGQHNRKYYALYYFDKVTIVKEEGKEPQMFIQSFPFDESVERREVSLIPSKNKESAAEGKTYLPAHIIGYSSGGNEILSLPFIKSRLIHLDEYLQAVRDNYNNYQESENSLIYIDNNMSQAVLLTCLLFEEEDALAPLRAVDNTGILGLRSFRMNIHLHEFEFKDSKGYVQKLPIIDFLEQRELGYLKKCATSWFIDYKTNTLSLDFYVDEATKEAFRSHFSNALECFHLFRLLYELNNYFIDERTKADVYRSKGVYTDGKLPTPSPSQDVFHFLDFYITKELKKTGEKKDLLLRSFSDGEHQFIHTMGICLLLKDRRTLLLLDEPETHFNPSWRAKFVKVLNDSIEAGNKGNDFNVHLLKDVLLTSHSPFVISDCLPNNVLFFDKDQDTNKLKVKKASQLGINTYGAGVDYILKNIFKTQMISAQSFEEMKELIKSGSLDELRNAVDFYGESSQKQFIFKRIYELTEGSNDSKHTKGKD
ncbi:restriction system-associated AAA family ATPase [Empedobacter falsenii]|uniref:Restriction system-associated AAA family ATPase n=1 Tax=Empedobacter falsenii TaxID=343874 RepID=A0AAW7DF69_9FLAO|nr:restriction system-associated AAA family ATPase [Empedobacter falsenii]MDM1550601.1 restriction system-associated AAA family ATPase [Empedobacter falsenii]